MTVSRGLAPRLGFISLVLLGCQAQPAWVSAQEGGGLRCVDREGVLLARSGAGWKAVKAGDAVAPGTSLAALFEADLESANKAVTIRMLADIGEFGPLPVLESAVRVLDSGAADATLVLERGVVILTNAKKEGAATVIVKMRGENVDIKLKTPGTKIGIEYYGRHPGGLSLILKDEPTAFVYALIGNGEATMSCKGEIHTLSAPPGPAMFRWDSVTQIADIETLKEFPKEFIRNDKEKARFAKMCAVAGKFAANAPLGVAASLVKSEDELDRRVAVTAMGALDDLPHLLAALEDANHKDVREQAILVLRSWMGRSTGQLKGLRVAMLKHKYPPKQVSMTMHLLVGFDAEERTRPAIYELLIHSLDAKSIGVRELAHWHLVRLAPAGRDIAYDAGAADADRQDAVQRWQKLIPPGELPPRPKTDK